MKGIELVGTVFNNIKILSFVDLKNRKPYFIVECFCGNKRSKAAHLIFSMKSCGCINYKGDKHLGGLTHGKSYSAEHSTYSGMKSRCNNPNAYAYEHYGGRGIKVCKEWETFDGFFNDMGKKPSPSHTLERLDNDGDYCKQNCIWATLATQGANKRTNVYYTVNGVTKMQKDWVIELGVALSQILVHMKRGRTFEETYNYYKSKYPNKGT